MLAGPEQLAAAVARLKAGGLVAFPTETVYGLGADALREDAVRRVFEIKGRPSNNPLIVHVSGPAMARAVVDAWTAEADMLAAAFWPGPLSIVLPKSARVPEIVTAGGPNVAVRCPDHPTALALLEAFGGPLVGPSANPSGRVSPTTAEHVRASFDESEVLVLDGGPCRGGIESTVVKLGDTARVLRPGLVSAAEIARVIGRPVEGPASESSGPAESPGMLASHYAPATPVRLCDVAEVAGVLASGGPAVVISHEDVEAPAPHSLIAMPREAAAYARRLYAALREADSAGAERIVVVQPRVEGSEEERSTWNAVLDRLKRAAAR
jgi:L-threonylcarbamoyladenylate synthase